MMRAVVAVLVAASAIVAAPEAANAQDEVVISITDDARPTAGGGIMFLAKVTCGPLPGTPEFTEAFAGASQAMTGAEGEAELSPTVVCDGVRRVYTAALSPFTEARFRRGTAVATVAVFSCNVVDDEQVCIQGSAQKHVLIAGPLG